MRAPRRKVVKSVSLGIYISVPFCRTKCSFCNFASGVFSRAVFDRYVDQVCREIASAEQIAQRWPVGGSNPASTRSTLAAERLRCSRRTSWRRCFSAVRDNFEVERSAEITVECAPGTITEPILEALLDCGVNRVSLGVQSFVDKECSSVGRLHTREVTLADIARLRAAGIGNIGIDLIAGLPYQTADSWEYSLARRWPPAFRTSAFTCWRWTRIRGWGTNCSRVAAAITRTTFPMRI